MATVLKAAHRLLDTEQRTTEVPNLRYINDALRYLETVEGSVADLINEAQAQQKSLAGLQRVSASTVTEIGKALVVARSISHKQISVQKLAPTLAKLDRQYAVSLALYEKHRVLEALETQIAMQFADHRTGIDAATSKTYELKERVAASLEQVLSFLTSIAEAHVPPAFARYRETVKAEVLEHVNCDQAQSFMYMNVDAKDRLVFTDYLVLANAKADDGHVVPQLYLANQWTVGTSITSNIGHEFEAPQDLPESVKATTMIEGLIQIAASLKAEGFDTSLSVVPMVTQTRADPKKISASSADWSDSVRSVEASARLISIELKPKLTDAQTADLRLSLYQEARALFPESKIRVKTVGSNIDVRALGSDVPDQIRAELVARRLGLNHARARKFAQQLVSA